MSENGEELAPGGRRDRVANTGIAPLRILSHSRRGGERPSLPKSQKLPTDLSHPTRQQNELATSIWIRQCNIERDRLYYL